MHLLPAVSLCLAAICLAISFAQDPCADVPTVAGAYACKWSTRTMTRKRSFGVSKTVTYCCSGSNTELGDATCTDGDWSPGPSGSCSDGGSSAPSVGGGAPSEGGQSGGSSSGGGQCGADSVTYGPPYSSPQDSPTCGDGESPAMCLPNSANLVKLIPVPINAVLALHNCWRHAVSNPAPASPLPDLQWDDKLAQMAERWAAQCVDGNNPSPHTPQDQLYMPAHNGQPEWSWVGQNMYWSSNNPDDIWGQCLSGTSAGWAGSEIGAYSYGSDNSHSMHYTQVIAERTLFVGCGEAQCSGNQFPYVLVCNYGPGGNFNGGEKTPYTAAGSRRRRIFNTFRRREFSSFNN